MTLKEFYDRIEKINNKYGEYMSFIVVLKYKYSYEKNYDFTALYYYYDAEAFGYCWEWDWNEGQEDVIVAGFIEMQEIARVTMGFEVNPDLRYGMSLNAWR